jgi:glycosyltransferase involved in cell wall biosynthesis
MGQKFRIHFVITGLGTGGAEMMLYKVISKINRDIFEVKVISLLNFVALGQKFAELGVPVMVLGMKQGIPDPRGLFQLIHLFRKERPHLVQTWMYHADLIGGLAAKLSGDIPVVWNIRHSNLDPQVDKKTTFWTVKVCSMLSSWLPRKIICCAEKSSEVHIQAGYDKEKLTVIPNGFDLDQFNPDPQAKSRIKAELSIPDDAFVIGLVARYHPQKDHESFFQAAVLLGNHFSNVHFVLCGDGVVSDNHDLLNLFKGKGLEGQLHLLGRRKDMAELTAAFDIATSSSRCGEGFPNTIGEAMACEVPTVATDVGDSAYIVGDTGRVVAPGQPEELARAWKEIIDLGQEARSQLGVLARQRILNNFSLDKITKQYEKIYLDILNPNEPFA